MMTRQIETSVDIAADAKTVWRELMNFAAYSDWNPFIRSIEGVAEAGKRLSVTIRPADGDAMRFRPQVQQVEQHRTFSWLGHFLIPGLFSGRHEFHLVANGEHTRFLHRETFSGLLVPLLWKKIGPSTHAGFEAMNQALKQRAEAAVSGN